jgi:hypothetical protein
MNFTPCQFLKPEVAQDFFLDIPMESQPASLTFDHKNYFSDLEICFDFDDAKNFNVSCREQQAAPAL